MSIQLKVYPQETKGFSATARGIYKQELADNQLFQSLESNRGTGNSLGQNLTNPESDAISNKPANQNWRSYNTNTFGGWEETAAPELYGSGANINGNLGYTSGIELSGTTSGNPIGQSGVYQLMEGLIVGNEYEIVTVMETSSAGAGIISYGLNGDTRFIGGGAFINHSTNTGTYAIRFVAQSTTEIFMMSYQAFNNKAVRIASTSVKSVELFTSFLYSDVYESQVILDTEKEVIPLTLSIDNFKNATEKTQSYSHSFKLPATKKNNKFFYNYYDVTVSNDGLSNTFNPHKQTKVTLLEDGIIIFEGFLKMNSVDIIDSVVFYNVNVYSEVITLKDTLAEKKLNDMDFTELEHAVDADNIENSWTGELELTNTLSNDSYAYNGSNLNETGVLKYPLCDYDGELEIKLSNNVGSWNSLTFDSLYDAFQPFIQVKYLINRIFADAGFNYESDFMNEPHFEKLYMDFSRGKELSGTSTSNTSFGLDADMDASINNLATTSWKTAEFNTPDSNSNWNIVQTYYGGTLLNGSLGSNNTFTCINSNQKVKVNVHQQFRNDGNSDEDIQVRIRHYKFSTNTIEEVNKQTINVPNGSGNMVWYDVDTEISMEAGDTLKLQYRDEYGNGDLYNNPRTTSHLRFNLDVINSTVGDILRKRGEMKQWDFLNAIMKMFNLVAMPIKNEERSIKLEPYNDIFNTASDIKVHDWTHLEDVGQRNIKPMSLNKHIKFQYVTDDKCRANVVYRNQSANVDSLVDGKNGSLKMTNLELTQLQGDQMISVAPFGSTVCTHLAYSNSPLVPSMFGADDSGQDRDVVDIKPRILYDNGIKTATVGYNTPFQNSSTSRFDNKHSYLQFSTEYDNSDRSLMFGSQQVPTIPTSFNYIDNLYNKYWSSYIDELYNTDTRIMTTKLVLSAKEISEFKFNDKIMLQNREFRVNRIDYRANEISTVELILIP